MDNEKVISSVRITLRVHLRAHQTVAINDILCKYGVALMMIIGVEIRVEKEILYI